MKKKHAGQTAGKKNYSADTKQAQHSKTVNVNREYKSDVFKMYFSIKKNAVELYNAMNDTHYTEKDLTINTLDNAVFLKIYNDVSFVVSGTINLYEHQASVNPNMPLRDLFYISDMYKPYGMKRDLYGDTLVQIPTPKFVVFYNGVKDIPDDETLKLSDAFINPTEEPELELKVRVLNINYGHNNELMRKCLALRDYSIFNERIRSNLGSGMEIEEAATEAVDSCIRDHVMESFLTQEKAGVIKMHVLDYNEKKHEQTLIQQGITQGMAQGMAQGVPLGRFQGKVLAYAELGLDADEIAARTGQTVDFVKDVLSHPDGDI